MSTLKVWCRECDGERRMWTNATRPTICPACNGNGYVEREVVELPEGRAVVVDAKAWEAVQRIEADMVAGHKYLARPSDGSLYRVEGFAIAILAALFTGGVYGAEDIGQLDCAPTDAHCALYDGRELVVRLCRGARMATLKEVGRGKA